MKTNLLKSISATFMVAMLLVGCDREDNATTPGTDAEEESIVESASIGEDASDDEDQHHVPDQRAVLQRPLGNIEGFHDEAPFKRRTV